MLCHFAGLFIVMLNVVMPSVVAPLLLPSSMNIFWYYMKMRCTIILSNHQKSNFFHFQFSGVASNGPASQPVRQLNGNNARLSPDSGRGSDKTGSDTSNSYASEKDSKQTSQNFPAMNGLPPQNNFAVMRCPTSKNVFVRRRRRRRSQIG
jgi:hypothetical protein